MNRCIASALATAFAASLVVAAGARSQEPDTSNFIRYRQEGTFTVTEARSYAPSQRVIGEIAGREVIELDVPAGRSNMGKLLTVDTEGRIWFLVSGEDKEVRIDPATLEMTEFQLPRGASPYSIAIDTKGAHWITAHGIEVLLEAYPDKGEVYAHVPPSHGFLIHINVDHRDDTVWFTMPSENKLVSFRRDRGFKEYELPTPESGPGRMDFDAQGNVWVPELYAGKIARLDPKTGVIKEWDLPTPEGLPVFCTVDSEGKVWISEPMADKYARFDPETETFVEFAVPTKNAIVSTALEDEDGMIWFTQGGWRGSAGGNKIGRLDPETRRVLEIALPTPNAQPVGIAQDHAGNIWFQQRNGGKIGRIAANERVAGPPAADAAHEAADSGETEKP